MAQDRNLLIGAAIAGLALFGAAIAFSSKEHSDILAPELAPGSSFVWVVAGLTIAEGSQFWDSWTPNLAVRDAEGEYAHLELPTVKGLPAEKLDLAELDEYMREVWKRGFVGDITIHPHDLSQVAADQVANRLAALDPAPQLVVI